MSPPNERSPGDDPGSSTCTSSAENTTGPLAAAIAYAERGLFVGPAEGKRPLGAHGFKSATRDAAALRTSWPDGANVYASLEPSGLLDIDVDVRHLADGHAALAELEGRLGPLPPTPTFDSSGGGAHYLLRRPAAHDRHYLDLAPHVELRVHGALNMPPSVGASGRVAKWREGLALGDVPIAELPSAWLEYAAEIGSRRNGHEERYSLSEETIGEGRRHRELLRLAGAEVRLGITGDTLAAVLATVNAERCDPPLPPAEIAGLLKSAAKWEPGTPLALGFGRNGNSRTERVEGEDGLHFVVAGDVMQVSQTPLLLEYGQRIPGGVVIALLGRAGRGKTLAACRVAADVSRGGLGRPPRDVLFLSSEDSASMIAARLEAAGADMARVQIMAHVVREGKREGFRLPRDGEHLHAAVERYEPALIVLGGSLMSHVAEGVDSHRNADMRSVIEPFHDVAERSGCAILVVVHPNKSRFADPGNAISGSLATYESVRSALLLERDGDDEKSLILAHFKHNYSAEEPSLAFAIEPVTLPSGVETVHLARTGTSDLTAVELLSAELKRTSGEGGPSKREQAKGLLRTLLGDLEEHPVAEVKAALGALGISTSTTERAKADLGVITSHDQSVPPVHSWRLPSPFIRAEGTGREGTGESGESSMSTGFPTFRLLQSPQSPQPPSVRGLDCPSPHFALVQASKREH